MNCSKSNIKFPKTTGDRVSTLGRKAWRSLQKFCQFSRFYGDYLAGLHSRQK